MHKAIPAHGQRSTGFSDFFCIITTSRIKSPQQGSCRTLPPIWSVPFTWRHAIHSTGSFCAGHCRCTKSKARDASQPRHEVVSVAQALRRKPSTGWERGSVRAPRPQQQGQLLGDRQAGTHRRKTSTFTSGKVRESSALAKWNP